MRRRQAPQFDTLFGVGGAGTGRDAVSDYAVDDVCGPEAEHDGGKNDAPDEEAGFDGGEGCHF